MKKRTIVLLAVLCLGLLLGSLYGGARVLESEVLYPAQAAQTETKTLIRDGVSYFPRQDITVLMILGIDRFGPMEAAADDPGAADTVQLLIFDEAAQCTRLLCLNRDTLVELPEERGEDRLAAVYSLGRGLADSCEQVKDALMQYLKGLTVDHYVALGMDALPILNDGVGGVRVNVREDFAAAEEMPLGACRLQGKEALDYVQLQTDEEDLSRQLRQQEYLQGFYKGLQEQSRKDPELIFTLYESAAPYLVTDCSAVALKGLVDRYAGYPLEEVLTPEGERILEEGQYRFRADPEKLDALVLELFYAPKK